MNRIKKWIEEFEKEYIDPDGIKRGKNGYEYNNEAFYNEYKNLLENRNNKFELHFDPRNEPGLIMINKKNKEKFWLKSDQFGFSAPSSKLNHVYDAYLLKVLKLNDDQKLAEAKKNVRDWISQTRGIGGSFFWPMELKNHEFNLNPYYNLRRGGTIFLNNGSYIEDRVDFTLWELYEVYKSGVLKSDKESDNTILKRNVLYEQCFTDTMKAWLSQFDSFVEYIDFFGLFPFIDENTGMPYDLLSDTLSTIKENTPKKRVLYGDEMTIEKYEMFLNRVAEMTQDRYRILKLKYENKIQ